ncbi:metallophosphoesterase family protein [Rhodobacter lacus]|uniref:Exonuclease SbcCD subunit D n=1 Tax=Rhodobacter lacus TaxID=1641972 RepID=A0ABW5ACP3_9RHOB
MRLLVTADIHLGAPIRSAALRNPALGARLRQASRDSLTDIVSLACAERVDVLVLAGDIFDRAEPDLKLRAHLSAQLARAAAAGVETVLIRGNHDALLDHTAQGALGARVHLLERARPSVEIGGVAFHGLSFETGHQHESFLPDYPAPVPGRLNVGLMHTSLEGAPGHDPYAPCAEAALMAHGYDLWCLGHIHAPFVRRRGTVLAVMPGIPQPRHFGERHGGSVALVTLGAGAPEITWKPIARLRFAEAALDLTECGDQGTLAEALRGALHAARTADQETALRIIATSATQSEAELTALAAALSEDIDHVHLDKLRRRDPPRNAALPEADDLMRLMQAEITAPGFRQQAREILSELRIALPREIADTLDETELDALLAAALGEVTARLHRAAARPEAE